MRQIILFYFFICLCNFCLAQQITEPTIFTTQNGLPSNVVYQCIEDDKGFLWMATDQGVVRYDGKDFYLFGKDQGVPDIEVFEIVKEKNGRIWIRCYNNGVAYYDANKNKFIDVTHLADLLGIKGAKKLTAIHEGGIQCDTELGSYLFTHNETFLGKATFDTSFIIKVNEDGTDYRYRYNSKNKNDSSLYIYHYKKNQLLSKRSLGFLGRDLSFSINENVLYIFTKGVDFFTVSNFDNALQSLMVKKHTLLHNHYMHNFTDSYLNQMHRTKDTANGKDIMDVYVYDKTNFNFLFRLSKSVIAFSMLNDSKGNLWMSTMHNGLYLFKVQPVVTPCLQKQYEGVNFYSVLQKNDGTLLAGNEKGEIVEMKNNIQQVHKVSTTGKIEWQRGIVVSQNKIFTFSDGGVFVNYTKEIKRSISNAHQESKVVLQLNDSIVLIGSNNGLSKLNTLTEKINSIGFDQKVILSLASIDNETIYIGSTDGLYCYNMKDKSYSHLNKDALLNIRITAMCSTPDNLLWVATATNGIVVLKNNRVTKHIRVVDGLNSNNSMAIVSGKDGEVWLGTNKGICRIYYSTKQDSMNCRVQNISTIDGLSDQIVNQLFYKNTQIFAATQKGVCMIPDNIPFPVIKVELTGIKINQKDTSLSSEYLLQANEKNISMQFSAPNLMGYFKNLDYSRDEGITWTSLDENKLRIDFDNGVHSIWVRAVDVNKNSSNDILKLQFDIATPYWKTWWFWAFIALLVNLGIAYALYVRRMKKEIEQRKIELAKANLASLEQQAFTSLMNPHFMFNALNSIQHYINNQDRQNANRYLSDFASLIRKNFEAAQQAFIPLEQEMENINLYLRLEKMRFNEKFIFKIEYDKNMEPDDWMMPTMILQPLVENSILHGIMPSQIQCELLLKLSLQNQDLLLEVIDNGIGIENSRAMKQEGSKHKSRGMELIHKRLLALSFFSKQELQLLYSVPYNDERNPGSKISLLIPDDLYQAWRKVSREM